VICSFSHIAGGSNPGDGQEDYYNYHRPHGALEGQTPFERLVAKTELMCHRGRETLHRGVGSGGTFHAV